MADNTIRTNDIIRGTYGRVWIDGELFANVKSFEAKLTLNYEEVDLSNDLGKHQRYMGFTGEGTMTLHKINSKILAKLTIKTGRIPARIVITDKQSVERFNMAVSIDNFVYKYRTNGDADFSVSMTEYIFL